MKNFTKFAGVRLRKIDIANFVIGMSLPLVLLFILFSGLRFSGVLDNASYWTLLLSGKRKLLYYFGIGFAEEFLFRGLIFGFVCTKIDNMAVNIILSAAIFAIPHSINTNAPIYILLIFSFVFGILACEMRNFTKSIWMSTAFHWTWNYSIVSVFMETNTNQLIYLWIIIEILILSLVFYTLCNMPVQK